MNGEKKKIALNMKKKCAEGYGYTDKLTYLPKEYTGFAEALPENIEEGYDFGGWEAPFYPGLTIIDLGGSLTGPVSEEFAEEEYVEGDITTRLNLKPRAFINVSDVISNLGYPGMPSKESAKITPQVVDNINRALLPGGKVRLLDDINLLQPVLNHLTNLGYVKIWDYTYEPYDYGVEELNRETAKERRYDIILQKPL